MYKIVASLFLSLFLATSCTLFEKESKPIDFNTIDEFPSFGNCDSLKTEELKKICFEETIVSYIQKDLDTSHFISQSYLRNTGLIIYVDVLKDGSCKVFEIEKINSVETALPELQTQIINSVKNIPSLKPATKQGLPVNARFMIPLYIEKE